MSERIESRVISRRKLFLLVGLAASFAVPAAVLTASNAEARQPEAQQPSEAPQRLDYTAIAPAGIKALGSVYGYIMQSGLPRLLVNSVYLRTSQINGCAYCIDMHSRDLIKDGLAGGKLWCWCRRGARPAACLTHANAPLLPEPNRHSRRRHCRAGRRLPGRFGRVLREGTGRSDDRDRPDERLQPAGHRISGFRRKPHVLSSRVRLSRSIPHRSTLGCRPSSASNNLPELAKINRQIDGNAN